jgi:tetratricopeptide (TPR) repeat protein
VDRAAQRIGNDLKDQPEVEVELRRTLGWVYEILGKYEQSEDMFRRAVVVGRDRYGNDHPDLVASLNGLGFVLTRQKKLAEAEAAYRDALTLERKLTDGRENLELASSLNGLAGVLENQCKLQEAEAMFREALAMRRKLSGNDDPLVANTLANLADSLCEQGKLTEAEAMFRDALAIMRDNPSGVHDTVREQHQLATVLQHEGKLAEAEAMYRNTLAMQRALLGSDHPFVAGILEDLASVLREQGKESDAEAMYREALTVRRKAVELTPNSPRELRGLAWTLATCPFTRLREPTRAVELATRATELVPQTGSCWTALGVAEYRTSQFQKSIETFQKANDLHNGGDVPDWYFLAMAHWQLGHKDEAHLWYARATEWTDKNEPGNEELLRFRTEAAEVLGINQPKPSTDPKLPDNQAPMTDH